MRATSCNPLNSRVFAVWYDDDNEIMRHDLNLSCKLNPYEQFTQEELMADEITQELVKYLYKPNDATALKYLVLKIHLFQLIHNQ